MSGYYISPEISNVTEGDTLEVKLLATTETTPEPLIYVLWYRFDDDAYEWVEEFSEDTSDKQRLLISSIKQSQDGYWQCVYRIENDSREYSVPFAINVAEKIDPHLIDLELTAIGLKKVGNLHFEVRNLPTSGTYSFRINPVFDKDLGEDLSNYPTIIESWNHETPANGSSYLEKTYFDNGTYRYILEYSRNTNNSAPYKTTLNKTLLLSNGEYLKYQVDLYFIDEKPTEPESAHFTNVK